MSKTVRKILLTSAGMDVKEEIFKIIPQPATETKVAHIITASKIKADLSYLEKENQIMREAGLNVENVDIEGKTEDELRTFLKNKDMIYVQGGNTFYLLKHVRASGFDRVVKELVENGVIYVGVSAGSYIACPTIEMAMWKHQDKNTVGLTDLTALNLVPFLLSVHYKSKYKEILKEAIAKTKYAVRIITDDQALLIQNGEVKLVGKGEEIRP